MSLQDISNELGITEAALYHYISSKDDLLNMVLSECYDTPDADEYNAVTAALWTATGIASISIRTTA
ncbi:TetR/AcrR family transcriptional regulator [Bifidobacterium catenulatum]|uniref:TetR/AcrR family transcriptional regulator n=1 Tax=Bifidobacterium catenulatum TaxID=1686 RepID=UPI003D2F1A51